MQAADSTQVVQTKKSVQRDPMTNEVVDIEVQHVSNEMADDIFFLRKLEQGVWIIISIIELLIVGRFILFLLGANRSGFMNLVLNLSQPFVSPFIGMFPSPSVEGSFFDTASVVALIIWPIGGLIINKIIGFMNRRELN